MDTEISKIQKTASTLFDLSEHTDTAYAHQIGDLMVKKTGIAWPRISIDIFSAFPVSRFSTSQLLLDLMHRRHGEKLQIVELGAGFTPHYLNLKGRVLKYIEVEFEQNSRLKKEIVGEIVEIKDDLVFVSGDILDEETWSLVKKNLDSRYPVFIFSEGVVAQYFSAEQKETLSGFIKDILQSADESTFVIDDTLRNHPELKDNEIIQEGMNRIVSKSGSSVYNSEFQTFEDEQKRWKNLFPFAEIINLNYIKSKPEMDFALNNFKLTLCVNNPTASLRAEITELSLRNKSNRIWK